MWRRKYGDDKYCWDGWLAYTKESRLVAGPSQRVVGETRDGVGEESNVRKSNGGGGGTRPSEEKEVLRRDGEGKGDDAICNCWSGLSSSCPA